MTDDKVLEIMRTELGLFKQEIKEGINRLEGKIDDISDPQEGVYAKIQGLEHRLNSLEKAKAFWMKIAWGLATPILGGSGWFLFKAVFAGA